MLLPTSVSTTVSVVKLLTPEPALTLIVTYSLAALVGVQLVVRLPSRTAPALEPLALVEASASAPAVSEKFVPSGQDAPPEEELLLEEEPVPLDEEELEELEDEEELPGIEPLLGVRLILPEPACASALALTSAKGRNAKV